MKRILAAISIVAVSGVALAATLGGTLTGSAITTALLDTLYLTLAGGGTVAGQITVTANPAGTAHAESAMRVNLPSGAALDEKAFAVEDNDTDRFSIDKEGDVTVTGDETFVSGSLFAASVNLSIATGNQTVTVPTGRVIRATGTTAPVVVGMVAPSVSRCFSIINVGAVNIVFANQSGSEATAGNRIASSTGADITVTPNQSLFFYYDLTTLRWRNGVPC